MTTAHFNPKSDKKIPCSCCGKGDLVSELYAVLELVRVFYNVPIIITSGYRCPIHNANVGGGKKSQHLLGTAADIVVKGVDPLEVYHFLDSLFPNQYGLGLYIEDGFVHVDVRAKHARW